MQKEIFKAPNSSEVTLVGNGPFGLTEKDAKFARWDNRKAHEKGYRVDKNVSARIHKLFEATSNEELLAKMGIVYDFIKNKEKQRLSNEQMQREIYAAFPDIQDYSLLVARSKWGKKLWEMFQNEVYTTTSEGVLVDDLVASRIARTLDGKLESRPFWNGKPAFTLFRKPYRFYFAPQDDINYLIGPKVAVTGNYSRIDDDNDNYKVDLELHGVDEVRITEKDGLVSFIKRLPDAVVILKYYKIQFGSNAQLKYELLPKAKVNF